MPGLVPGIHVFAPSNKDVDGRDKPGHDGYESPMSRHALDKTSRIEVQRSNLARLPGRRLGDSIRRGECGSRGSRLVTSALGRLGQDTPGRHHDRTAGAISLDWDSKARVTPASDAWRPAVGFASCVAMRSVFRTIGAGAPNEYPGSRVARAERWRSVAAVSAVVERREASASYGGAPCREARRLRNSAFRRSAFLFLLRGRA